MTTSPDPYRDPRLCELFVRYWDNALSDAEAEELEGRLLADPAARAWFQSLCLQAVTAAELTAVARANGGPVTPAPARRWSRRRVLRYAGAGLVSSVAAALAWRQFFGEPDAFFRLTDARGMVKLFDGDGESRAPTGPVPPGGMVFTQGLNSSAVLSCPDGSDIALAGDTSVAVAEQGRRLLLKQGNATADVRPQPPSADTLILATAVVTLTGLGGSVTTLGHSEKTTEVGVLRGLVMADSPSGERLDLVSEGEVLKVSDGGEHYKRALPATLDEYAWDLTRPLPRGWHVGRREITPDGPVVRPEFWFDPYHQAVMSQIRSDKQWTSGFFRLFPDSIIRVRYWIEQPGPSQLCFCVRTAQTRSSETGMLECNGAFEDARPRQWQWLTVRAGEMLDNIHTPLFGPPWIGFLVIFNTYRVDLGLRVAEFRVTRPGWADLAW